MKIKSTDRISNSTVHKRCRGRQAYWWLRDQDGDFVEVPEIRGDDYFEADLELEPGTYTLGVGPQGKHGIRETIVVE